MEEINVKNKFSKKNILIISIIVLFVVVIIIFSLFVWKKTPLEIEKEKFTTFDDFDGLEFELLNNDFSEYHTSFRINIVNNTDKDVHLNGYTLQFLDENDNVIEVVYNKVELNLAVGESIETSISKDMDLSAAKKYRVVKYNGELDNIDVNEENDVDTKVE